VNIIKLTVLTMLLTVSTVASAKIKYYPHTNPDAPYSVATQVGDTIYLAGQVAVDENGKLADNITDQSHQVMQNISGILSNIGLSMDDVFKCTVMIDDIALWPAFNKVYVSYFTKGKLPARSAFGVDGLAYGSMLEVECMAHKRRM
jgi:reactive intermediate/imine deaminase